MFAPRFVYGDLDLTDAPFGVEPGATIGDAETVTAVIDSLLVDGELLAGERDNNREITLAVLIEGPDLADIAAAEALLVAEARQQRNTLTVEWGDGIAPATVLETFRAQVSWQRNDDEDRTGLRRYTLTIPALPFTRSLASVVDNADTPPSDGGTLLYNAESTTGWSQYRSPFGSGQIGTEYVVDTVVFTEGAGSLRAKPWYGYYVAGYSTAYTYGWADQVTGLSLDTDAGGYLALSVKGSHSDVQLVGDEVGATGLYMTTVENGEEVVNFIATGRDEDGFVRYVWPVEAGLTVTGFRFYGFQQVPLSATGQPYVYYDDFRLLEAATTDKQIVKQLTVEGSARTTGSLLIAAPADEVALGRVLVITAPTAAIPAGYTPDGRRWVTQGATTADVDAPSGSYFNDVSSTYSSDMGKPIFEPPASLFTAGPHVAVVSGEPQNATPFAGVRAQLVVDGTLVGELSTAEQQFSAVTAGQYGFFPVGTLFLPPTPVLAPNSDVRVRLLFAATNFRLDDVLLIPAWSVGGRPVADFSIIDCGSGVVSVGGPSSHLWLDSPSADQPQGGYWRGPDASKQLAVSAWADADKPGLHVFEPGGLTAFVASTDAQGPRVELSYFPAWYGAAAQ